MFCNELGVGKLLLPGWSSDLGLNLKVLTWAKRVLEIDNNDNNDGVSLVKILILSKACLEGYLTKFVLSKRN